MFQTDDLECPICKDLLVQPTVCPCGHAFCRTCYMACTEKHGLAACPVCRQRLPMGGPPAVCLRLKAAVDALVAVRAAEVLSAASAGSGSGSEGEGSRKPGSGRCSSSASSFAGTPGAVGMSSGGGSSRAGAHRARPLAHLLRWLGPQLAQRVQGCWRPGGTSDEAAPAPPLDSPEQLVSIERQAVLAAALPLPTAAMQTLARQQWALPDPSLVTAAERQPEETR